MVANRAEPAKRSGGGGVGRTLDPMRQRSDGDSGRAERRRAVPTNDQEREAEKSRP